MWSAIESTFTRLFLASGGVAMLFVQSLADIRLRIPDRRRILRHMMEFGVHSLPLASLIGLFTGMIIAYNIGIPMKDFGQEDRIGTVLGVAIMREFAPVFTAFIVAARVGAAMTAELGTMAVSEEVDSLRVLGIRPTQFLAMPRIVASLIMNPLLTVYSTATGLLGGFIVARTVFDVPSNLFWVRVYRSLDDFEDMRTGLVKSLVFAALISSICVYNGLVTKGGARGVGASTTRAVVVSLTMILVADLIILNLMVH